MIYWKLDRGMLLFQIVYGLISNQIIWYLGYETNLLSALISLNMFESVLCIPFYFMDYYTSGKMYGNAQKERNKELWKELSGKMNNVRLNGYLEHFVDFRIMKNTKKFKWWLPLGIIDMTLMTCLYLGYLTEYRREILTFFLLFCIYDFRNAFQALRYPWDVERKGRIMKMKVPNDEICLLLIDKHEYETFEIEANTTGIIGDITNFITFCLMLFQQGQ